MRRANPDTSRDWRRVGPRRYEHLSGAVVAYQPNQWVWKIEGGDAYGTLHVAQHFAVRELNDAAASMPNTKRAVLFHLVRQGVALHDAIDLADDLLTVTA